jgi:hypothetical protein
LFLDNVNIFEELDGVLYPENKMETGSLVAPVARQLEPITGRPT